MTISQMNPVIFFLSSAAEVAILGSCDTGCKGIKSLVDNPRLKFRQIAQSQGDIPTYIP